MISICIPIFNHDVRDMVGRLMAQKNGIDEPIELVCIDDRSRDEVRIENREIAKVCKYVELEQNVGRSRIRNLFLKYVSAECEYMIFMDCDLQVDDDCFLVNYVNEAKLDVPVVVGGHRYRKQVVDKNHKLHYIYGTKCETKTASERSEDSNRSFMTGNFMIKKTLLSAIRFDERLKGYGHEDTLFGYRLKQKGVEVKHIDNPLWVQDLDENKIFMNKTEVSVRNLWKIVNWVNEKDFEQQVSLMSFYRKVEKMHLKGLIGMIYGLGHRWMRRRFDLGCGNMLLLKLYKLGLLIDVADESC